ncbi:hypothetical protein [Jeotgalibaca dankookensis]|uniref:hypothetical protein n=1 Tax=Jeotgalibaca dankookensis TaxID=708126 RepID=UPI0007857C3A|nr:hypothetical protein [Jeotgalibaca dankookensis]
MDSEILNIIIDKGYLDKEDLDNSEEISNPSAFPKIEKQTQTDVLLYYYTSLRGLEKKMQKN